MIDEFYTVEEVAKKLKVTEKSIRDSINKGRMIAFKPTAGKKATWRIAATELGRIQVMDHKATLENLKSMKKD